MNNNENQSEVLISETFNAPVSRVFATWTDPEKLIRWYAPNGCSIRFLKLDIAPGGRFHSCISNPQFGDCWCVGEYLEIQQNRRIVFTMINADENGNPIDPTSIGMDPDWPGKTLVTVTFSEENGKTKLELRQNVPAEVARKTGAFGGWLQMLGNLSKLVQF